MRVFKRLFPYLLLIILFAYIIFPINNDDDERLEEANKKIKSLKAKIAVKEIAIVKMKSSRDSALTALKDNHKETEIKIITKYDTIQENIIELDDEQSVILLQHNVGTK